MTIVFLQTIGLFHQNPEQRASSSLYHGMVVLVSVLFRAVVFDYWLSWNIATDDSTNRYHREKRELDSERLPGYGS